MVSTVQPSDTFTLVDRIIPGGLSERLKEWRSDGLTIAEITFRLRTEHDVNVASTTVWRWVKRVEDAA